MPESQRRRLVFAACRAPYPLDNGGRIRAYNLAAGLARTFETTFVTFDHPAGSPDGPSHIHELSQALPGVEIVTVPAPGRGKRGDQLSSLLRQGSWALGRYYSAELAATLQRTVSERRPSVVHFDDPGVALAGSLPGVLNAYCSHNIEERILHLGAKVGSPLRRAFNTVEARKVGHEERRIWRSMDLCLAVSELDGEAMKAGGARRVEICPNGATPVERLPMRLLADDEPMRLLFVGSGNYAPYERGLAWFVGEVMPRLRARVPVVFDVVGQPPARPVSGEGVRYVGRVPELAPYYDAAHAVVVPVFEGSGTRLKIVEAMAYGRPLVSTRLGAEGLPVRADEHFLQADDADDFAAALVRVAQSLRDGGDALQPMLRGARTAAVPMFWPSVVERLAGLYERRIALSAGGSDARGERPVVARN